MITKLVTVARWSNFTAHRAANMPVKAMITQAIRP